MTSNRKQTMASKTYWPALAIIAALLTYAPYAYGKPVENRNGVVTIAQARSDARQLAARVTTHRIDQWVPCRHTDRRPSAVTCQIRESWTDEDGVQLVKRWVVESIATRGGRWASIKIAAPYATGLVLG